jgi:hypothetical protein
MSRDRSVGIATGYGLDDRGSIPGGGWEFFSSTPCPAESHPASYTMGTGVLFLEVRRPGGEADRSPLSSAEVKECVKLYLHSRNRSSWRGA